jgi:hypothetical protein
MKRVWMAALKAAVIGVLLAGAPALAQNQNGQGQNNNDQGGTTTRAVPEFDPTAVGVIAAIVAGGGLLVARRRRSR